MGGRAQRTATGVIWAIFFSFLISYFIVYPTLIHAQDDDFNLAHTMDIEDKEAVSGDVMSLAEKNQTLVRSKTINDAKMYGVLVSDPIMVYRTRDTIPVARTGDVWVNVTTMTGPILVGDYVTSSPVAGKAQKADTLTGYMLGIALTAFDGKEGAQINHEGKTLTSGKILVSVGIGPASPVQVKAAGGLFGTFKQLLTALLFNIGQSKLFDKWLRYIIAALVALLSIYISFRTFGRNIQRGIEAIGRNPLAKMSIQTMIIMNAVLIGVVSLGGIILALAILSL